MLKKMLLILVFIAAGLAAVLFLTRPFVEGSLEALLSRLFGLKVRIEGLKVNPATGEVTADAITFHNPKRFSREPHLDVRGIRFTLDLGALRQKHVRISKIELDRPLYFIERIVSGEDARNNVMTWYHHMKGKGRGKEKKEKEEEEKAEETSGEETGKRWRVTIDEINLYGGMFLIHQHGDPESEKKFVFRELLGSLKGFEWPSRDPSIFNQTVTLRGLFGELYPVPFEITGTADFATGQGGFDLIGQVRDGQLIDYQSLWQGLPIQVKSGFFDLDTHAVSRAKILEAENQLILKSLAVVSGASPLDKVSGLSIKTWIRFVQDEDRILLDVPVRGQLSDPTFHFDQAFRQAFQASLKQRMDAIKTGAVNLASKTGAVVKEQSVKIAAGTGTLVKGASGALKNDEDSGKGASEKENA